MLSGEYFWSINFVNFTGTLGKKKVINGFRRRRLNEFNRIMQEQEIIWFIAIGRRKTLK